MFSELYAEAATFECECERRKPARLVGRASILEYWRPKLAAPPPRPFKLAQIWADSRGAWRWSTAIANPTLIRASFHFDGAGKIEHLRCRPESHIPFAMLSDNAIRRELHIRRPTQASIRSTRRVKRRWACKFTPVLPTAGGSECWSGRFRAAIRRFRQARGPARAFRSGPGRKNCSAENRRRHRKPRRSADRSQISGLTSPHRPWRAKHVGHALLNHAIDGMRKQAVDTASRGSISG